MQIEKPVRVFMYNGVKLDDPNPNMSIEQVRVALSAVYGDIATAELTGPEPRGNKHVYTFRRSAGMKG